MTELHESGIRAILNLHTAPTLSEFRESNRKAREEILQATRAEGWNDLLCDALKDTLKDIDTYFENTLGEGYFCESNIDIDDPRVSAWVRAAVAMYKPHRNSFGLNQYTYGYKK